jgi:ABC-type Mn2+/Zn2+ transport system permease subunit
MINLPEPIFFLTIASGILVAAASGLIGSFLVTRKMTLLSDALSHVALPGIALGIIFKFQPLLGGLLFLLLGTFLIWQIQHKTRLATESVTGVLFVTALALGALLIPESELLETFFGDVTKISLTSIIIQSLIAIIIIGITALNFKKLVLASIAPELTGPEKISQSKMEFLLLTLIALTIVIGISFVGILLMSAISIIPAATARNLSQNFKNFIRLSIFLAIFALTGGLLVGEFSNINPGIATVLISAFLFALSLAYKK